MNTYKVAYMLYLDDEADIFYDVVKASYYQLDNGVLLSFYKKIKNEGQPYYDDLVRSYKIDYIVKIEKVEDK